MKDSSWMRLIEKIHDCNVVPVIGSRLLVGTDGHASLQARIADRLLAKINLSRTENGKEVLPPFQEPLLPFRELNDLVTRLKGLVDGQELQDIYESVHDAIREETSGKKFVIPEPIAKLAAISDFRLLVTLTPDDLLARSLRRRTAVDEIVHSPNLPTSQARDLSHSWNERMDEVHLLYLFGKSISAPMFAIHDEDLLEYAHNVLTRGSNVPAAFLDELQQRNLLLIGCNFPDWLTRFFLRTTNRKRLSEKDNRSWMIEPLRPEESLAQFLRSYSRQTEILSQDSPVEFVAELHRRWMAEHGGTEGANSSHKPEDTPRRNIMFFLSYSRTTDRPRVERLYDVLVTLGVAKAEVWFDRETIEPGDDFRRRIIEGIHGCRYFVPLISLAADVRDRGFVFAEWDEATQVKRQTNRNFLFPVIVDAEYEPERYQQESVFWWRQQGLHFGHAPDGDPDDNLRMKLTQLVRDARRGSEAA